MEGIKRFQFIETIVPANAGQIDFPYISIGNLRDDSTQDIIIRGIEMWPAELMPLSPLSGIALATNAQLGNSFLNLYIEGEESIQFIPAIKLIAQRTPLATSTTTHQPEPARFKNLRVNFDKTYFRAATPYNIGGANTQFSLLLGIDYLKLAPGTWAKLTANQIKGL